MATTYSTKINTSVYIVKEGNVNNDDGLTRQVGLIFTRNKRYLIYIFILFASTILNMDNGFIPASVKQLRNEFTDSINYLTIGLICSVSFLGNISGKTQTKI